MATLRAKLFTSASFGWDVAALEAALNDWLEAEHPDVRHVTQSSHAGQGVAITVLYAVPTLDDPAVAAATAEVPGSLSDQLADADLDPDRRPDSLPEAELPY